MTIPKTITVVYDVNGAKNNVGTFAHTNASTIKASTNLLSRTDTLHDTKACPKKI